MASRFVPRRGLDRVVANLRGVRDSSESKAERIASQTRLNTPKRTGTAAASVRVEETEDGHRVVAGGGAAWYFTLLEYGTSDTPTFAPLRRAAESAGNFEPKGR